MELFQLFGKISVDGSKATAEIDKVAQKANQAGAKMGESFTNVGNKMTAMGRKMAGVSVAAGAIVTAVAVGIGKSYAEYEQLVGGVETLFGKSSNRVIKYAENAYKTAGLSANQYMEQATSFSASLLQSLGGDTKKAADYADMAIRDMSDNSNKMGTDMQRIQDAYQGFAKQNFMMLDNLKLGYGGTKTEMERLLTDAEQIKAKNGETVDYSIDSYADMVDAIHVVQTEMGITGTTAKEASTTISGSWNSLKASWTNFLTEFGKSGADMDKVYKQLEDSAATFAKNIGKLIGRVFKNNPFLVITVGLLAFLAILSPVFIAIGSLITIIGTLITVIPKVAAAFRLLGASMMANPIGLIIAGIVALIAIFVILWKKCDWFRNFWKAVWDKVRDIIIDASNKIFAALEAIKTFFTEKIPAAFNKVVDFFKNNWQTILLFILNPFAGAVALLYQKCEGFRKIVDKIVGFFKAMPGKIWGAISSLPNKIKTALIKPIELARDKIKAAIDKIKSFFKVTLKFKGIKLPHISVSWKSGGALGKIASKMGLPGIPNFGVKWYRKAMNNAMLLNSPTIFGMDGAGQLLGGGDAGQEVVAGSSTLMNMIKAAVDSGNGNGNEALLSAILSQNKLLQGIDARLSNQKILWNDRELGRFVRNYA